MISTASFGGARLIPIEGQGTPRRAFPVLKMRRFQRGLRNAMPAARTMGSSDRTVAAKNKTTNRTVTTDRSFVAGLMKLLGVSPKELGGIIGRPSRTAERYVAGDRLPDAVAYTRIVRSPIGDRLIRAATRGLPHEQRMAIAQAALAAEDRL